jgi:hypothetical protein
VTHLVEIERQPNSKSSAKVRRENGTCLAQPDANNGDGAIWFHANSDRNGVGGPPPRSVVSGSVPERAPGLVVSPQRENGHEGRTC